MLHLINRLHFFTITNNIIIRLLTLILTLPGMSELSYYLKWQDYNQFDSTEAVLKALLSSMKAVHLQK